MLSVLTIQRFSSPNIQVSEQRTVGLKLEYQNCRRQEVKGEKTLMVLHCNGPVLFCSDL